MPRPTVIGLSDHELSAIKHACRRLQPGDRSRFLREAAQAIAALPERGDGAVHRAIAAIWREFYDAPLGLDESA
jgi:hypothetical protein